jgi:NAD+ kinase
MTSTSGSMPPSARAIRRVAVVTHGSAEAVEGAIGRVKRVADAAGVELLFAAEEAERHGLAVSERPDDADLAVVLGGDGTMLRALQRFLGSDVPVIGVNYGRVGFLASLMPDMLAEGLARAFRGEIEVVELATLEAEVRGFRAHAINDIVVSTAAPGRMVKLSWALGGEDLGSQPCDGMICATPAGSTAYNLSNGGPVLVWGLEAMSITFVAPHSLTARPLVVPRSKPLGITNSTRDVDTNVIADGHTVGILRPGERAAVRIGSKRALLASLPEMTFFRRYRNAFR